MGYTICQAVDKSPFYIAVDENVASFLFVPFRDADGRIVTAWDGAHYNAIQLSGGEFFEAQMEVAFAAVDNYIQGQANGVQSTPPPPPGGG